MTRKQLAVEKVRLEKEIAKQMVKQREAQASDQETMKWLKGEWTSSEWDATEALRLHWKLVRRTLQKRLNRVIKVQMGGSPQPLVGQEKVFKPMMAKEKSIFWMPRQPASGGEPGEPASGGERRPVEENVSVPAWTKTIFERQPIGANDAQWKRLKSKALAG